MSSASAGNRTRVTSMATMYSTTRPLMLMIPLCPLPRRCISCQSSSLFFIKEIHLTMGFSGRSPKFLVAPPRLARPLCANISTAALATYVSALWSNASLCMLPCLPLACQLPCLPSMFRLEPDPAATRFHPFTNTPTLTFTCIHTHTFTDRRTHTSCHTHTHIGSDRLGSDRCPSFWRAARSHRGTWPGHWCAVRGMLPSGGQAASAKI